jgi:hypothetical protein
LEGTGPAATSLEVVGTPAPKLSVPNYRTRGTYPTVAGAGVDLAPVNATLREAVLEAQRSYASSIQKTRVKMPWLFRPTYRHAGVYQLSPKRRLTAASTVVVSTLIPLLRLLPGGNNGSTWLSVTVEVPSGRPVALSDLFAEPKRGLRALASAVKRRVEATNACIRQSVRDPLAGGLNARGFRPTPSNYRYFALTPSGLAVGLPIGQVGGSSCGRVEATVPYDVLHPFLSQLGRKLVAGVRRPRGW